MDFTTFKLSVIEVTGLAKDALHIYVGVGVYLLCLFILRPIIKKQAIRSTFALLVAIGIALLGEYFDNKHIIAPKGLMALEGSDIKASIHDLINTCLLPFVLYTLTLWTTIFHPSNPQVKMLRQRS
ncbi:hypothetical protein [Psychrobacter sp. DM8]|uniref:hypothetical protein n=1 Tax=unclassified Psychrobacter TaxID=196806 RepID=UPI003F4FE716